MVITAYNSEDKYYKSVKGGLKAGESVRFRMIVPRSFGANSARLSLKEDSQGEYLSKGMYWAGMYGDEHEVWDIETQIPDSGLYWYHFDISSPWGRQGFVRRRILRGRFRLSAQKLRTGSLPSALRTFQRPIGSKAE